MRGGKILKFLISLLIITQVLGFVFGNLFLSAYTSLLLSMFMLLLYLFNSKKVKGIQITVLLMFIAGELLMHNRIEDFVKIRMISRISVFFILFYFLYNNHKSFVYNKRDIFTLVLGTSFYTVIFILVYFLIKPNMSDLSIFGFLNLLLLYILLVVGAMHYINIRSEKSLWFFLSMLNFVFVDYIWFLDQFYIESYELKIIMIICEPMAMVFLVNYMITKSIKLKAEEFEGF